MQDDAMRAARIHPSVHPGNRTEVFIWREIPVGKTEISGTEPARPLI